MTALTAACHGEGTRVMEKRAEIGVVTGIARNAEAATLQKGLSASTAMRHGMKEGQVEKDAVEAAGHGMLPGQVETDAVEAAGDVAALAVTIAVSGVSGRGSPAGESSGERTEVLKKVRAVGKIALRAGIIEIVQSLAGQSASALEARSENGSAIKVTASSSPAMVVKTGFVIQAQSVSRATRSTRLWPGRRSSTAYQQKKAQESENELLT